MYQQCLEAAFFFIFVFLLRWTLRYTRVPPLQFSYMYLIIDFRSSATDRLTAAAAKIRLEKWRRAFYTAHGRLFPLMHALLGREKSPEGKNCTLKMATSKKGGDGLEVAIQEP